MTVTEGDTTADRVAWIGTDDALTVTEGDATADRVAWIGTGDALTVTEGDTTADRVAWSRKVFCVWDQGAYKEADPWFLETS